MVETTSHHEDLHMYIRTNCQTSCSPPRQPHKLHNVTSQAQPHHEDQILRRNEISSHYLNSHSSHITHLTLQNTFVPLHHTDIHVYTRPSLLRILLQYIQNRIKTHTPRPSAARARVPNTIKPPPSLSSFLLSSPLPAMATHAYIPEK